MRFILVDRIHELVAGKTIVAEKTLSPEEELFRDHFPGFAVVPGVLLIEMMAQAGGKCLDAESQPRGYAMLAQIRSASFRQWVRPGETARIFATIVVSQPDYATARCHIEVAERTVCSAELMFAFVPAEQFVIGYRDPVLQAYLEGQPATCEANASIGGGKLRCDYRDAEPRA
ncbi:MAG TPA: 3-hydroxyacyl-ACP dehydratase FabZ family protein [Candidatus Paceibacterota bacterium]|nr:3-hydroxyacyl-ACP dehydratase FabZ family protein [Candidatus Paceibacterota bacterium]